MDQKNTWLLQLIKIQVFIDNIKFKNSSVNKILKNMTDNDLKRLSQEFKSDLLELVKEKGVYPYKYIDSFVNFFEYKLPDRCEFFSSLNNKFFREKKTINMLLIFGIRLK